VHLDAAYDSALTRDLLAELGCQAVISQNSFPLQAGARAIERTNSWRPGSAVGGHAEGPDLWVDLRERV
jgi:hypothetical protein